MLVNRSTARHAHVPAYRWLSCSDLKFVAKRLACEQFVKCGVDLFSPSYAQQVSELHLLVMAKAAVDSPGGGDANAVAARAEVGGEGSDEP